MTAEQPSCFGQALKLRVEDYLLLAQAGSLAAYPKTELIDGTIFVVSPLHRPHARAVLYLLRALSDELDKLATGLEPLPDASVDMPPQNMPRPDIVITDEPQGEGFVPVASVRLLVEVSDSTLSDDLGIKARLYSEQRVPEYWVIDLAGGKLHQLSVPGPEGYDERREIALGEPVEAVSVPGLRVSTDKIARIAEKA